MSDPFDSQDYTYEIKWDGYRCLVFLDTQTKLQSRNLKDISAVFPELTKIHLYLKKPGTILDGEIIALRNGKPSFLQLQKRGQLRNETQIRHAVKGIPVVYVVFDLLYLKYQSILNEPIETRRILLAENLKTIDNVIVADFIDDQGIAYFKSISKLGLEGVIAKKKRSLYLPGKRTETWLKFKRKRIGNFIICGYRYHPTSRSILRSIILGAYFDEKLTFFGMVGTGFSHQELGIMIKELERIKTDLCPFIGLNNLPFKDVVWTEPIVVCEVEYLELTDDGILRHPSFKRIRPDLRPKDCVFDEAWSTGLKKYLENDFSCLWGLLD